MASDVLDKDPEFEAIRKVYSALKDLDGAAQNRVLDYVINKLNLTREGAGAGGREIEEIREEAPAKPPNLHSTERQGDDDLDGISPVAQKWMRRNSFTAPALFSLFSLGVDEIDLVAKAVPGKNKKERMHSVGLLKGIASYLGSGAARFTHEQMKEACLHYDAYDAANFAAHMKSFSAEVAGSKENGYTLTARGLTAATDLVRQVISAVPANKALQPAAKKRDS